jgi:hypothetical protein
LEEIVPSHVTKDVTHSQSNYVPPRVRNIVIGIALAGLMVLGLSGMLPEATKLAGDVLLYAPETLGLVRRVRADEVQVVSLASSRATIEVTQLGVSPRAPFHGA